MGGGGGYLLLVLNPPWTPEHKEAILQRVAKGLLSWDVKATGTDLASAEKACLSVKVSAGPHNELLIQHSTESLALEVLLNPEVSTLRQCFKNMMVSGTTHKHVIHAGYAFAGSGDWILQDGVFSARDVEALLHDAEVQEVLRRQKFHTLHVHCSAEGSWAQPPVGVSLNPPDIADNLAGSSHLLGCLDAVLTSPPLTSLLPSSSVVGNIRFRRPTMYVFPGGQGDCALFGVTGFTLLVDGGFARKPCFWEFVRHLDRLDSLLVTRFNQFNSCGLTALAQRKALERVYPQVGHVFCNAVRSPSDEELQKDRDQLVVSVVAQGLEFLQGVREMGLSPQACQRDARPLTLYHKVGHGTLEMFVLSPGRSTEEDASVCALLVWRPAKVSEPVTRILLPGSASQSVIFEGLSKLGHLAVLKSRAVTAEARLGLKKSKVQDKPLRATSVPPRPSVAKRAAAKVESPSPSPTPPPAEKVRAPAKQTNKSIESLPKKQDEVKRPTKTGAKKEPKKSAVEKTDAKDEKAPKITAKVPAKVAETMPDKEKIVEKLGENELDNIEEKDISKIINDKALKKLPVEIEKIDSKAQEEIVAKVEEKVAAKRELKKATPTRPPAKSKGAKDVTNKMAVESKTIARKTAEPAKVKPRPVVAPPTRPMVRDSKSKSPSSSASSSPKRTPPKPTTERPVRSVRGGVRNAKPPAAEPVKVPEGEKPVLTEKPTAQVKPDKRIEVVTQSGDESSGSKEAIEEKAATEATKEDKPFIEPSSSDESKKDIPKQKSPVTVDEAPIKAVLLGTAHAAPTAEDFQAVPTKSLEKEIADAKMWPTGGDAKELTEPPEHALSPEPTVSASSEGVPSLIDEVIDISLKADSSVARQVTEPELSRVRALSSGQRTPDSLDTPHEVGDGTAPSSRDEILEAMEKHHLVSREQVLEIKRRDSVDSIEGEIAMEDEEIVHPPQEADQKTAEVPISAHIAGQEHAETDDYKELKPKLQQPTQHDTDLPSHDIERAIDESSKRSLQEPCAEPPMVEPQIESSAPEMSVSAVKDIAHKQPHELTDTSAQPMIEQQKQDDVLSTVPGPSYKKPSEPSDIELMTEKPTEDTKQEVLSEIAEKSSEPPVIQKVEHVIERPAQKTPESKVSEDEEEKPAKPDAIDKIKPAVERPKEGIPVGEMPEVTKKEPAEPESMQKLEPAIEKPAEETTYTAVFEVAEKPLGESEIVQKAELEIERPSEDNRVSSVLEEVQTKRAEPEIVEKAEPEIEAPDQDTFVSAVPVFVERKPAEPEVIQKLEPEIEQSAAETPVTSVPEDAEQKPTSPQSGEKGEPAVKKPAEETPEHSVPDVAETKAVEPDSFQTVEPEIEKPTKETPVSAPPEAVEKKPTEREIVEMVEQGIERPAEETRVSAAPVHTEKKAAKPDGFQPVQSEIERPAEETPLSAVPEVTEKKPTESESVGKVQPETEISAEEIPVSAVPEVTEKKPTESESVGKVQPETEISAEEIPVSAVPVVAQKKPTEPESVEEVKPEIEGPSEEAPVSAVPEALDKKPTEPESVEKMKPETQRLAEETPLNGQTEGADNKAAEPEGDQKVESPVSAMREVAEKTPTEHDSLEKMEPEVKRPAEETPVTAVPKIAEKKPAEPEGFQKVEAKIVPPDVETPSEPDGVQKVELATERPAEKMPESAVLEVVKNKPTEADGVQEVEPEIERPTEKTSVSKVLDIAEKQPIERDGIQQFEPGPESHAEQTPVSTVFEVADKKPAQTEDVQEVELEIEKLPDETAVSTVPEIMDKKPVDSDGAQKVEPEVERRAEVPSVIALPDVTAKKPCQPEDVRKAEQEIEKLPEKSPVDIMSEVEQKKLAQTECIDKEEPETEKKVGEIPVGALPEVTLKKPVEPEGDQKVEPEIESPAEKTPISAISEDGVKKPTEAESAGKMEQEIQRPAEETPVGAVPAVAEKEPAEPEGLQEVEPDVEKPAEMTPMSIVPEVGEKKPIEPYDVQKGKPEIERSAEKTHVSAVPEVTEKQHAEPEGLQKVEREIERPAEEAPVTAVSEVAKKKPAESDSVEKEEPETERAAEETLVTAVPEVAEKKLGEPESVNTVEPKTERPVEATFVGVVPEVAEKKPTEPDDVEKAQPYIDSPGGETPVSAVPEVAEKPDSVKKEKQEIQRPDEEAPVSSMPEVAEKKPAEPDSIDKGQPEIERTSQEIPFCAVPEFAQKKPTEPDDVQKGIPQVERPAEEAPVSAMFEVVDQKPAEPEGVRKAEPLIQRPAEETSVSAVPEFAGKKHTEPESVEKIVQEIERPPEETLESLMSDVVEKKPAEPEVGIADQETPVSAVPEFVEEKPTEPKSVEKGEPEIERPSEKSPVGAVPEVTTKKPTEPEGIQEAELEIGRAAEETPLSAVSEVAEKKPTEPESVENGESVSERSSEETPVGAVRKVVEKKPTDDEGVEKGEPEIERPFEETPLDAVLDIAEKKPDETEGIQKAEPEIERAAEETLISAVPEVAEKPTKPDSVEKGEPEIERPAEETPVSAIPEVAEKKPAEPEGIQKAEPEIGRTAEETPVSAMSEIAKKPTEVEGVEKGEPKIERLAEQTLVSAIPEVAEKKPIEAEGVEKGEPEIERPAQEIPVSAIPEVAEKTPAEPEGIQKAAPEIERAAEETLISTVPEVAEKPTKPDSVEKEEPEIERPAGETPVSAIPEVAEKKPAEPEGIQKAEPEIGRAAEETPVSAMSEIAEKKPTEGIQKAEPEIERAAEETPVRAMPEVAEKKPTEVEGVEKGEPKIERPVEETLVSAIPEMAEKKPTEAEGVEKGEPEIETPAEETPVSAMPEVADKKPAEPEGIQKAEPEIGRTAEETPVSDIPEVAEKTPAEPEGIQKGEPEIERAAEETPISTVPEVAEKPTKPDSVEKGEPEIVRLAEETPVCDMSEMAENKPTEAEGVEKGEPEIERPAEETPVSAIPEVAEKKPAEPEGIQKGEPEIERPAEETPISAVPEVVEKPTKPDSVEKVEPEIVRLAEETPLSAMSEVASKKPAEPEGIRKLEPEIERAAEETPISAVPEVAEKPTEPDGVEKGEPEIVGLAEETHVSAIREVAEKKPSEPQFIEKGEPDFQKAAEETPMSRLSDVTEKKFAEPEAIQMVEPDIERPVEHTPVSTVPEATEKKPTQLESIVKVEPETEISAQQTPMSRLPEVREKVGEPEGIRMVELEIERPAEDTPLSAVPEVTEKKPTQPESVKKVEPETEISAEESPVSTMPEVTEKKPVEPEGTLKAEQEIGSPAEETLVSAVPEVAQKKPTKPESVEKKEPEVQRPAEETPVSVMAEVAEKKPSKPEGIQETEPDIGRPAEGTPVSAVPEVREKKPVEPERIEKVEPQLERQAEKTPVSVMPDVTEKKPAEPEGVQKVQPAIERRAEESPVSAVPEAAKEKSADPEIDKQDLKVVRAADEPPVSAGPESGYVQKVVTGVARPVEETPVTAVPEVADKKSSEVTVIKKVEPDIQEPAQDISGSAGPELVEKKPAYPKGAHMVEPEIEEEAAEDTPVSTVHEIYKQELSDVASSADINIAHPEEIEEKKPHLEKVPFADKKAPASSVSVITPPNFEDVEKLAEISVVTTMPMEMDREPTQRDDFHEDKPLIEKSVVETPASGLQDIADSMLPESIELGIPEMKLQTPSEIVPSSSIAEIADEKPIELQDVEDTAPHEEHLKPSDRGTEKLQVGKPEGKPSESSISEVTERKPAEVEHTDKGKEQLEQPAKEAQNLEIEEPHVEDTAKEAPASTDAATGDKTPAKHEHIVKEEPQIDTQTGKTSGIAEKGPAEIQHIETEDIPLGKFAEKAPVSTVPHTSATKPSETQYTETEEEPEKKAPVSAFKEIAERKLTKPEDIELEKPCIEEPALEAPVSTLLEITDKKTPELEDLKGKAVRIEKAVDKSPESTLSEIVHEKAAEPKYIEKEEPQLGTSSGDDVTKTETSQKEKTQIYKQAEKPQVSAVPELSDEKPSQPEDSEKDELECEKPAEKAQLSTMPEALDKTHIKTDKGAEQGHDLSSTVAKPGETEETHAGSAALAFHKEIECPVSVGPEFPEQKTLELGDRGKTEMHASDSAMPETDEPIASLKHQVPEKAASAKAMADADTLLTKAEETILQRMDADQQETLSEQSSVDQEGIVTSPGEETADEDVYASIPGDQEVYKGTTDVHEVEDFETRVDDAAVEGVVTSPLHSLSDDYQHLPADSKDEKLDGVSITELQDGYQKEHVRKSEEEPSGSPLGQIQPQDVVSGEHGLQEPQVEVVVPDERKKVEVAEKYEPSSSRATDHVQQVDEEYEQQDDKEELRVQASAPPQSFLFSDTSSSDTAFPEELSELHQSGYLPEEYKVLPSTALIPEVDGTIAEDLIAAKEQAQKQLEEEGEDGVPSSFSRASSKQVQSTTEKNGIAPHVDRLPDFAECSEMASEQEYTHKENLQKDDAPVVSKLSDDTYKVSKETPQHYVQERCEETDPLIPHGYGVMDSFTADKAIEPGRLSKGDELSQKETGTVAAVSEENFQSDRYKLPETKDIKGSDEHKQSSPVSQDSERYNREVVQYAALLSEEQADLLTAHEEPVLHAESDTIPQSFMPLEPLEDDRKMPAPPTHRDEDHVDREMPTDTDHILPITRTLGESVSPQPCSTKEAEIDVTKQELHLALSPALGIATSVYSKAKELLEECAGATDSTSPGGAISTGSPKSSVSEDSFRSVVQKDDGRDVLITEERCADRTCDEDIVSDSGVTTGYDFRSPSEVLKRGFLEETSHTLAREWDKTMVLQSPSQDEEGRRLLEIIKSQLVCDESADSLAASKERDLPAAKDIPPADSSKYLPHTTQAETGGAGLEKSPDSTRKRDEVLAIILDQITKDDWDGTTHSEPEKIQVSKDSAEVPSMLSEDSTTKFDSQADAPLGSEDQREPSSPGHLLMKGPPEEEKSVPVSSEPATTVQKPESPSAHIEVFEQITPETSLFQESGSIKRDLSEARDDGSALPDSNISQSLPADESSVNLSEEKVHYFPLDLDASSPTDLSSSPVALKESAGRPDLRTMSDKEPESTPEVPSIDLGMAPEKSDVCDARLSSEPEGTKVRDEASYGEAGEKETASSDSPPLIRQEQDTYEPEAPWIHHRGSQDASSREISDQPMKDPRATGPTSLDAPELAHMQQRMSVEYESSITSVSDIEFGVDAKPFAAVASEGSSHYDSKTAEGSKGGKDASRPSSPESPPQSPVKSIAAEHPRTSRRARTVSESKHPIPTQGSSEADISSEDEDSAHKVIAHSYTDTPSYVVELPKESPQPEHSSQQVGFHPVKDLPLEGNEYRTIPRGADDRDSRHSPLEVQPDSFPHPSGKTEGLHFSHKRTPSEEGYLPIAEGTDEAKKNGKGSEAPQLPSQPVADPSTSTKLSKHDVQVPPSLLEPDTAKMSGDTGSHPDETYSSQLKRSSIEGETTSSSDDAGSGRMSLTGSKDSDLMREYTRHLETTPSARFSVDSTCSVTSEERSYTELEKPYQKEDSGESFSSTARDHPDQSSRSGSLYSDFTLEPSGIVDHHEPIAPHVSSDQVELGSSADALFPVRPERPAEIARIEPQFGAFATSTTTSAEMESDVEVPLGAETVTREPDGRISSVAKIPTIEARQPVTVVTHGHGIASGLFAALKTELCVIDSPSMGTVLDQTGKDAQGFPDQAVFDTSPKFSEEHRELDSREIKVPEVEREAPTDQAHSDDCKVTAAHHTSTLMPEEEFKETYSLSGDEALPGRKVSGEITPVKALRFQLGDDTLIEPLPDQTAASASCTSSDADHGLSKEVFEKKVRLEKFLEAEFLETMATDEEDESSRASVKPSTTSTTSSSHHENGHKVPEPEEDVTDDDVTLASGLSSGLPTELVCMAQSSVDLPKDINRITKCADSQERVSPPPASPLDAVKQDEPAAVAAGLASGLPVELVCMVESRELCSEIKRAEEEAIHHVIEKKADYAEEDDGVAMQAYIERRLSDSDHFTDKQQRASPSSETVPTSQHGMPTPERKPSKGFDELHLNGTSHSPPSVGLVAGLAAGLATELVCMPQSAEELCIDASESRWPPARGSHVEPIPPEMTASVYEELTAHAGETPCSDTDIESVGQGTPDSAVLHRMGQIPVQREVITTVTSRRVVYQHDGPPDTWTTSTFSEPPQHDTEDDSRRTTVTYVYRTYTSGEGDDKGDPTLSSGTVPSRQGEDGLPFDILRSNVERRPREEDIHDGGDHIAGTSSRSYVYTVSSDHGAPETFIRHTDDTETLHHPDSSIHSIAMDEVARITEMAAAAVTQSPNGWTVVHRSADSSSQRPLELTRPTELVEGRNGHATHVTETREIVYHPSSSAEFRFALGPSAEETCLPPEGSDPKTILEFMAAQTKQAAKEMLEEQPLYEEDEDAAQEQSSLSDASPLVEEPVFGKTLQPDYPELVELSAGNTPSEPPSPHSAAQDTRARHNGEPSGTTSVQRMVVVEETEPTSTMAGGSEARRVVSYVEEPTTVVREEWVLESGRGEASHVISQSSMFQHEVLTREESTSAGTASSPASTGHDAIRFTTLHHLERDLGAAGDVAQRGSLKASVAAAQHEQQWSDAEVASRTDAPHDTVRELQGTSAEGQTNGRRDGDAAAPFDIRDWGKPLGLPVPPDPSSKSSKTGGKKAGAAATPRDAADVVYVDLTYVPHHGDPGYCDAEFFSRVRARYYVLSGTNPSQQVLDALLEAKRGWGEPDAPVTVIPTYETDALCYWIAHNQKALEEHHIDVAPSASRCTINLQDHESSCAAYRLEF
ncbi:LOW QUALITY PROTEIN: microtubule-associated protein futsch-like [Dermacentor silvarum]|uniref:LOW QUALITY PROTEIN: microtubule-associated protein futsch-like n=1 Tax=Dermacentor silvarum TaxID=543639 RepID=UPI002101690C|nr:LOW QUALITY PROTEIN: microtubule-associated protein futsch-like [Dermacentor silvarum]